MSFTVAYAIVGGITLAGVLDRKILTMLGCRSTKSKVLTTALKAGCIITIGGLIHKLIGQILILFATL